MGFYDFRCSVSGLSLQSARAVLVAVLEVEPGKWSPVSLPVRGDYNRYGTIENPKTDFRTAFLASDMQQLAKSGRLKADQLDAELAPLKQPQVPTIVQVINLLERGTTLAGFGAGDLTLDGKRLRQTLIFREVYDAAVGTSGAPPRPEPSAAAVSELIAQTFETDVGRWFARDLPKTTSQMRTAALSELLTLNRWLAEKRRPWLPSRESGQHGPVDSLAFHSDARARFPGDAKLLKIIEAEARRLEKMEEEESYYGLPDRWLRDSASSWYGLAVGATRVAATELASLRRAVELHVSGASAAVLLAGGPEILAVQCGVVTQRVDLRPLIRLEDGAQRLTLSDPAAGTLSAPKVLINWDEIETALSPLQQPLASGEHALYPLQLNGAEGPPWAQADEKHIDSFARFALKF